MSDLPLFETEQGEEIKRLKALIAELEQERDALAANVERKAFVDGARWAALNVKSFVRDNRLLNSAANEYAQRIKDGE